MLIKVFRALFSLTLLRMPRSEREEIKSVGGRKVTFNGNSVNVWRVENLSGLTFRRQMDNILSIAIKHVIAFHLIDLGA